MTKLHGGIKTAIVGLIVLMAGFPFMWISIPVYAYSLAVGLMLGMGGLVAFMLNFLE